MDDGQLQLGGIAADFPIGDELDRCYTPQPLADSVVRWVHSLQDREPQVIVEPSVGGGSFVRAIRKRWPGAWVIGCDLDENAAGLRLVNQAVIGDWRQMAAQVRQFMSMQPSDVDLVIGNPPFSEAIDHWLAGPTELPTATQALIMPWGYPGVKQWVRPFTVAQPTAVRPILGRPWPKRVRETAVYVRQPSACESHESHRTELVLPPVGWQVGDR